MISGRIHLIVDEQLARGPKNMPEKSLPEHPNDNWG